MSKPIFDYNDGDFIIRTSDSMAMDMDGNIMIRMSDTTALDMETGDLHIVSSWQNGYEDDE